MSEEIKIPEFPKNHSGLKRGTILRSISDLTKQLGIEKGEKIPIGFDGKYVRCLEFTWSIEQIQDEILSGIWEVIGEVNLLDSQQSLKFARNIEQL